MVTSREKRDQYGKNEINDFGLVLLGNSGVGKSFLANIITGEDTFLHAISAQAVTCKVKWVEIETENSSLTIFDLPGLIEAEQEHVNSNIAEIDKAFRQRPNCLIMFVFGHENGRIRNEDVAAFQAINAAYSFQSQSLAVLVNGLPRSRPENYQMTTVNLFKELFGKTGFDIQSTHIYFLDAIDPNSIEDRKHLENRLFGILNELTPKKHQKKQTINTLMSQLRLVREELVNQKECFNEQWQTLVKEMRAQEQSFGEAIAKCQSQTKSLQGALDDGEERADRADARFEKKMEEQHRQIKRVKRELRKLEK